jgi:L-alanine exporter
MVSFTERCRLNFNMADIYTEKTHRRRAFIADTTALILFFTTTGVFNERFLAGMSWDQVLHARMLGAALMVPVGRPYGVWRDYVMGRAQSTRWLSQLLWDSVALVSFQVPIYAAIIAVCGASGRGLWFGVLGATVMMLVLGRPYGAFLNGVRRLFGLPSGGTRPMSLNA